ncbi:methylcrotonoyl-CoA carboxylase, partial [Streptomyces sp. NPDC007070]
MHEAPELTSAADPASEAWRANEQAHRALVEELRGKLAGGAGERGVLGRVQPGVLGERGELLVQDGR